MPITNKGHFQLLEAYLVRVQTLPTNFYIALVTSAVAPSADTNTLSDLTEIAAGNGYQSGGGTSGQLTPGATDFTVTEDDANDRGQAVIKNITFTASGGNLPQSGSGARYAVLLDDNATPASRKVLAAWDLGADRTVSDGQPLNINGLTLRLNQPA